jgi:O-antigen ligase
MLATNEITAEFAPEDLSSNYSILLRGEQLRQVLDFFKESPIWGTGLGSTLIWYDAESKTYQQQETVDVGWGYLLVKFGIIGSTVFVWFILRILIPAMARAHQQPYLGVLLLILFWMVNMLVEPVFFNFLSSAWVGVTCGYLYVLNRQADERA